MWKKNDSVILKIEDMTTEGEGSARPMVFPFLSRIPSLGMRQR